MARPGKRVQRLNLRSDAGTLVDEAFLAHYVVSAEDAVAADDDGVRVANLGATAQAITTGITNPAVPRALSVVGNVSGITGNVKITGTNFAGEAIDETIALNGTTAVHGNKAFKTITKIDLPVQVHTPAAQAETIQVTAGCSAAGNLTVTITAAALGEDSPLSVTVPVTTEMNEAAEVATAIKDGLNADATFASQFTASAATDTITITAKTPAANDATLEIAVTAGATGVTVGSSTNGITGVPYDIVKVGWNDKLGLPFRLAHNTVTRAYLNHTLESTNPTVTVSATAIESNTVDLNSALDGHQVDIYFYV